MPEASSTSTLTIPGGVTQDSYLLNSDLAGALGVTGATVDGGTGNAINANTYYQPVDARQIIQGRTVVPIQPSSAGMDIAGLPSLTPAPLPAIPDLKAFNTPKMIDIAPISVGINAQAKGLDIPDPQQAKPIMLKAMTPQLDRPGGPMPAPFTPNELQNIPGSIVGPRPGMPPVAPPIRTVAPQPGARPPMLTGNATPSRFVDNNPLSNYFNPGQVREFDPASTPDIPEFVTKALQPEPNRVKRLLKTLAAGMNSNIAAQRAAETQGKYNLATQALQDQNANFRQIHSNMTDMMKQHMVNEKDLEVKKLELEKAKQLTHEQALNQLEKANKMDPDDPVEGPIRQQMIIDSAMAINKPELIYKLGQASKSPRIQRELDKEKEKLKQDKLDTDKKIIEKQREGLALREDQRKDLIESDPEAYKERYKGYIAEQKKKQSDAAKSGAQAQVETAPGVTQSKIQQEIVKPYETAERIRGHKINNDLAPIRAGAQAVQAGGKMGADNPDIVAQGSSLIQKGMANIQGRKGNTASGFVPPPPPVPPSGAVLGMYAPGNPVSQLEQKYGLSVAPPNAPPKIIKDPAMLQDFLAAAGGDKAMARELARQYGYVAPSVSPQQFKMLSRPAGSKGKFQETKISKAPASRDRSLFTDFDVKRQPPRVANNRLK